MNREQQIIEKINMLINYQESALAKIKDLMSNTQRNSNDYDRLYGECLNLKKSASDLRCHVVNLTQIYHTKLEMEARS